MPEKLARPASFGLDFAMDTSIRMTGADSAHYREAARRTSRLVLFPDGVSRLINLTGWQWDVLADWHGRTGWYRERLLEQALQIARLVGEAHGADEFELDVRIALVAMIEGSKRDCLPVSLDPANQNETNE